MGAIYAVVAILFGIYLVLRIGRMLNRPRAGAAAQKDEKFDPNRLNTAPLPERTPDEIARDLANVPTEWVTYAGMSPPLQLQIRGQSYESYRRMARKHIDIIGQAVFERFTPEQMAETNLLVMADAYVTAWKGATYPNGNPMPYSPQNLAIFMAKDPHLAAFVNTETERISPPWPTKR